VEVVLGLLQDQDLKLHLVPHHHLDRLYLALVVVVEEQVVRQALNQLVKMVAVVEVVVVIQLHYHQMLDQVILVDSIHWKGLLVQVVYKLQLLLVLAVVEAVVLEYQAPRAVLVESE
jgi:hypothetical protein